MFSRLNTASLCVSEILGSKATFYVPSFQRNYSWTVENARILLDDLLEASGIVDPRLAHDDYFLGPILLVDKTIPASAGHNGASSAYAAEGEKGIVDGLQRLLTLTTIAAVLRDLDADEDEVITQSTSRVLWDVSPNQKPAGFLKRLRQGAVLAQPRITVTDHFSDFISAYVLTPGACKTTPEDLESLSVDEVGLLEVRNLFYDELSALEKGERKTFANFVFEKCHFLVAETTDDHRAHVTFKRMNDRGKPLERYDLLKAHVMSSLPPEVAERALAVWQKHEKRLGEDFSAMFEHLRTIHEVTELKLLEAERAIIDSVGGAENFIFQEFDAVGEAYYQIMQGQKNAGDLPGDAIDSLVALDRFNNKGWMPSAILALMPNAYSIEDATRIIREIERYEYITRFQMIASHKRKRQFGKIRRAVKDGSIASDFERHFPLSRDDVRTVFFNLRDLYERNTRLCKPLLLRLNDKLSGKPILLDPRDYSIEHVLPRRIKSTGSWREAIPDNDVRQKLTHSLGNLTLITQKDNHLLANKDFHDKKKVFAKYDEKHALHPLMRSIMGASTWDQKTIESREAQLLETAQDLWRI